MGGTVHSQGRAAPAKRYSFHQVCDLLNLPQEVLSRWERLGLVVSCQGRFDFQDLVSLQTVTRLVLSGVDPTVIARCVRGLAHVLPDIERPLAQLRLVVENGELLAELEEMFLAADGQFVLKFEQGMCPFGHDLPFESARDGGLSWTARDWHDQAIALEEEEAYDEAIASYRRALSLQTHFPEVHLNLGYLMRAIDHLEAAEAHFQMAVSQDPKLHVAWYNLAEVQERLGLLEDAVASLKTAMSGSPSHDSSRRELAFSCGRD